MNDATRTAQRGTLRATERATQRLPAAFDYPLGGIVGRLAIGLALVTAGGIMLWQSRILWVAGGVPLVVLGGIAVTSNLRALLDPERRRIILDDEGVEIRYGLSRRFYRFLDYSDYRVSRLGVRRFLTALPIELDRALGKRAERVRVTIHDRPAFLTPMPLLGRGAPATLQEWQSTLNQLRRAALANAGLLEEPARASEEEAAEEARRVAIWQARAAAGAKPSRLSRAAYVRWRIVVASAFFALLLLPIGSAVAVRQGVVALCGTTGNFECLRIDPMIQHAVLIGGPILAVLVFMLGHACIAVRRAHDLDEDLPFWKAALGSLGRLALQRRLSREEGTAGTNRFGPAPPG